MGDSPIRSISWKRGITVINVRAPRMLGAYGFLRAMFEVFERHEVVVDVLASGEVSVSLTVEDRSRLEPVIRELSRLGEVWIEDRRAIVAVVGIGLRHHAGPRLAHLQRGAARERGGHLPGRVGHQHDVRGAGGGWPGRRAAAAPGVLRRLIQQMQIVIVGNGRMGRAVAALAAERGHAVRVIGREENAGGAALTPERLAGVDVAIEFTRPDAVAGNLERLIEAGVPTVTGTTGWTAELPRIERLVGVAAARSSTRPTSRSACTSFSARRGSSAALFAKRPEFGAFILEEHHAAKLDAPVGHRGCCCGRRLGRPIQRATFLSPRCAPASSPAPTS